MELEGPVLAAFRTLIRWWPTKRNKNSGVRTYADMLSLNALLDSHIEKYMAYVSRPDACVMRCRSAIQDRQVYEKPEHIELLGSEAPSKHVLQQLLCCIESYSYFSVGYCYNTGAMCISSGLHTNALFKIYRCTIMYKMIQVARCTCQHLTTCIWRGGGFYGWIECHVSFWIYITGLWPLFRTCWNQHARVCFLFGKWTVEAPSFWSRKDQLRACSTNRSSHPSSGSDVRCARSRQFNYPERELLFLQ